MENTLFDGMEMEMEIEYEKWEMWNVKIWKYEIAVSLTKLISYHTAADRWFNNADSDGDASSVDKLDCLPRKLQDLFK